MAKIEQNDPPTAEDLHKWSERIAKMLDAEEPLTFLIRGQLMLEQQLYRAVRRRFPEPKHFDSVSLGADRLITLAAALDLIDGEYLAGLRFINKLRNKVAHGADYEVTIKDENDFMNAMPAARHLTEVTSKRRMRLERDVTFPASLRMGIILLLHYLVRMLEYEEAGMMRLRGPAHNLAP